MTPRWSSSTCPDRLIIQAKRKIVSWCSVSSLAPPIYSTHFSCRHGVPGRTNRGAGESADGARRRSRGHHDLFLAAASYMYSHQWNLFIATAITDYVYRPHSIHNLVLAPDPTLCVYLAFALCVCVLLEGSSVAFCYMYVMQTGCVLCLWVLSN